MSDNSKPQVNLTQDTEFSLNPFSGVHHSFDIKIAQKYGGYEAILIHHFLFWINLNARKKNKKNFKDGRTWTYQTLEDIAAHFPYLTKDQVRGALDRLTTGKSRRRTTEELDFEPVIIKGNFNKTDYDKTNWYAFKDEQKWGIQSILDEMGNYPNGSGQLPTPIPDAKPDAKHSSKEEYNKRSEQSSSPPSAEASELFLYFLSKLKSRNPKTKQPDKLKWSKAFDCLLRRDKRSKEEIIEAIDWIDQSNNGWFRKSILSPESLRCRFDQLIADKSESMNDHNKSLNRRYAVQLKEKYPQELKKMIFDKFGVTNPETGKDISFNLSHEVFKDLFVSIFGGQRT